MVLTITKGMDEYGNRIYCIDGRSKSGEDIHKDFRMAHLLGVRLKEIAEYVNNELKEECLFEIDY